MDNDLISRKALKEEISKVVAEERKEDEKWAVGLKYALKLIDNAQAVPQVTVFTENADETAIEDMKAELQSVIESRPKGEREFIELEVKYLPDDITPTDYRGKPYYSIHYKENGEEFVGFGTYKPEVLSKYLKENFMQGGA